MKANPKINEQIKEIMLIKYIERGYTIKREGNNHYRMWNKAHKLYLCLYEKEWCIAMVDTYTASGKWIERPKSALNYLNGYEVAILAKELDEIESV